MAQHVLISGGANGLGLSLANCYRQRGARVTILDIEPPARIDGFMFYRLDLNAITPSAWPVFSEAFDIVICNAGISVSGDFVKIPDEAEQQVMDVNFTGHMKMIKYLLRDHMIRPGGRLAFVCSATRFLSFPIAVAYSASKGALDGFAQALESYLTAKRISVTRIYPGPMNTGHSRYYPGAQTEGGRKPEESVPAIVRAIDKRRRMVCPDPVSRFYCVASKLIPGVLARKTHAFYKDRLG